MVVTTGLPEVSSLNAEQVDRWIGQLEDLRESNHDAALVGFLTQLYRRRSALLQFKQEAVRQLSEQNLAIETNTVRLQMERSRLAENQAAYASESEALEAEVLKRIEFISKVNEELLVQVGLASSQNGSRQSVEEILDFELWANGSRHGASLPEKGSPPVQQQQRSTVEWGWVAGLLICAASLTMGLAWALSSSQSATKTPAIYQSPSPASSTGSNPF